MEVRAVSKSVRMSPRKVRLVADSIRHLSIEEAFRVLQATDKRASTPLAKTLKSAVANAVNNAKLEIRDLSIASIMINEGQSLKRFRPSTRGRIHPYKKRGSNITIVVKSTAAPVAGPVAKAETKELPAKTEKVEKVASVEAPKAKKTTAKKTVKKEENK